MRPLPTSSLLLVLLFGTAGAPLVAQGIECPSGNLLAGLRPIVSRGVSGDPARVTDQRLAPEGAPWDSPPALRLEGMEASLTWDLGAVREVRALALQADANDRYTLSGSLDGRDFVPVGEIAPLADATGLRRRTEILPAPVALRYLRLDPPEGDGFASVSELEVFCQLPQVWPPALAVEPVAPATGERAPWWDDLASRRWELLLALLGIGLLIADRRRERAEGEPRPRSWRIRLFGSAALAAALTYFNFGAFHFGGFVHNWDTRPTSWPCSP